jgi:probable phosphoglycerate mutase
MSRTVYYLIRHATTLWNLRKRIQGHWDCELSPEGTAEAKALAPRLAGLNLSRILCSDWAGPNPRPAFST